MGKFTMNGPNKATSFGDVVILAKRRGPGSLVRQVNATPDKATFMLGLARFINGVRVPMPMPID